MSLLVKYKWPFLLLMPVFLYVVTFPLYYNNPDIPLYFNVYSAYHGSIEHDAIDANKEILVSNNEGYELGDVAPDFTLPSIDGEEVSLSSQRGKYVFLSFWASWCPICRGENQELKHIYEDNRGQNFEIMGVSLDREQGNWERAVIMDEAHWIQVSDLQGVDSEIATKYGVYVTPTSFLIDPDGKIIGKNLKGEELSQTLQNIFEN